MVDLIILAGVGIIGLTRFPVARALVALISNLVTFTQLTEVQEATVTLSAA